MYIINYHYFERDLRNNMPKGFPIYQNIKGETIKEINNKFSDIRNNHNVFDYTLIQFDSIEETKK